MENEAEMAVAPDRERQVITQKENLNGELESLEKLISRLRSRLESVLRNPEPMSPPEDCVAQEMVPLAHEIRAQRENVLSINEQVRDILNRIEI